MALPSRAIEAKEIVRGDVLVQYAREKMMTYDIVMVDDGMVRKDGSVVHASEGPRRGTASADVSAARGVASEIVLTLEPPREVSGRVVFEGASARPPLTGMQVSLTGVGASSDTTGVTVKDDGAFVIPNVAPGRYVVTLASRRPLEPDLGGGRRCRDARLPARRAPRSRCARSDDDVDRSRARSCPAS